MMKKVIRLAGLISFVFCLAIGQVSAQDKPVFTPLGSVAPALTVKWLKGGDVGCLKKGQVYVVEFWATWCLPCIAGMPHLSAIAREYKDVTVIGCSVLERKTTDLARIEKFVAAKRDTMDYHVAADDNSQMAANWLHAYGERGIPVAFIVNKEGLIAWIGHPLNLDKILPQIVSGKWDVKAASVQRVEKQRLTALDQNIVITTLNPFMGNPGNPQGALAAIDGFLKTEPGLKYYYNTGHFTFWSLIKTDPQKALDFGKAWIAANEEPRYSTITDATFNRDNLPPALYVFAADAYQAQLDRYPWSMDFPATYKKMADLYAKAGNDAKAKELLKKADEYVKR